MKHIKSYTCVKTIENILVNRSLEEVSKTFSYHTTFGSDMIGDTGKRRIYKIKNLDLNFLGSKRCMHSF